MTFRLGNQINFTMRKALKELSPVFLRKYDFIGKLPRDLSNRVHLKSISKFINKVINRYFFLNEHLKTGPSTKILSVNNFVNKLTNTL